MNWHHEIRSEFARCGKPADDGVVEELAQHAEAAFEAARADGETSADAEAAVRSIIASWCSQTSGPRRFERPLLVESTAAGRSLPLTARAWSWVLDARRDAMHAVRLLRRNPMVTVVAVLSLAIGIGGPTTVFTVANALLFQPPAGVSEPHRLVDIGGTRDGWGFGPSSYPTYLDIRQRATTVDLYAYSRFPQSMSVRGPGVSVESAFGIAVTAGYFDVLGAAAAVGRLPGAEDGADAVVVLSHRFWTRRFNGDPAVVGRTLGLNGRPFTVVGVASEAFNGTGVRTLDLWVPLPAGTTAMSLGTGTLTDRAARRLLVGGRLRAGVSTSQAAAEMEVIGHTLEGAHPENRRTGLRLLAASPVPGNGGPIVAFMALVMVLVSFVLIAACANVAGVLLARASARRQEIALRRAIGAGRARLVRQLLTETLLLFALGGAAGLLLARGLTSILISKLPLLPFPVTLSLPLDLRVLAFIAGLSLVAALLSGLAPAVSASRADVLSGLRNDAVRLGRLRLRHGFVVVQVALTTVLIVGAGLFARALHRAASLDLGFQPHGVELLSLDLAQAGYTDTDGPRFARELLDRVRQLPGVQAATIASSLPGGFEVRRETLSVAGTSSPGGFVGVDWAIVEPGYFATLRTPIAAGRDFTIADRAGAQAVAIVSEATGRRFWPGQAAVGQYLSQPTWGPRGPGNPSRTLLVIGVARDVQSSSMIDGLAGATVYVPLQQQYASNLTIAVRSTRGDRLTDEVRSVLASMNPNLPILSAQTLDDSVALGLTPQRVIAPVAGSLGIIGLALAALGIYGVMAYAVTRRTREIGIRVALGARPADVIRMVLGEGFLLVMIGSAIGLVGAAAMSHLLAGFLFGIPPIDPITFAGTMALLTVSGLVACCVPVRRATEIDPAQALRAD